MEFFKDSKKKLRTYEMKGEMWMWFVLDDVLNALELERSDIMEVEDDIRKVFNGKEWIEVINERGFYYLMLFESNTEEANQFYDWVMNTVVRSIAKKGYYMKGND